jgi:hypothetical protein
VIITSVMAGASLACVIGLAARVGNDGELITMFII